MPEVVVRILLIGAEAEQARTLAAVLGDPAGLAAELVHAATLAEAYRRRSETTFACILLDLDLGSADANDPLDAVLKLAGDTPVLVLSAPDDEAQVRHALARGAQDFLPKDELARPAELLARMVRYAIERAAFVTRIREEEQQRRKLQGLVTMAGGVAHDFSNLLTVIRGHSERGGAQLPREHAAWHAFAAIGRVAAHAQDLTAQLLTYAGKRPLRFGPVDLAQTIIEALQLLDAQISEGIGMVLDAPRDLPPAHGDHPQLSRVIINLVANAIQALAESGRGGVLVQVERIVEATTRDLGRHAHPQQLPAGEWLVLRVTDNGPGIPEALIPRIFDPYVSTKGAGRGLGLAAVLGIVRQHEGVVQVHSSVDRGSTFTVWLHSHASRLRAAAEDELNAGLLPPESPPPPPENAGGDSSGDTRSAPKARLEMHPTLIL